MSDRTVLKRVLFGAAGAVLLFGGVAIGAFLGGPLSAFAAGTTGGATTVTPSTGSQQSYCQLYLQTLASNLGVSVSKLESANQAAAQKVIDKMYADGKITAAEKTKLENRLKANASNPCAALAGFPHGHGDGAGPTSGFPGTARAAIESAVATSLNISTSTLESDLQAGKTIPQIASAQHVSLSVVNTAYLNAVQAQLNSAVKQGMISQAMADNAYNQVKSAVAAGHYPLLDGGLRDGGHFGAPGF